MRQAERITLFVKDRDRTLVPAPDITVMQAVLRQAPLVSDNPDGSRTFIFDLAAPAETIAAPPTLEGLRGLAAALGDVARGLGLPLTAALADSAELVAEAEALERAAAGE